MTHWSSTGGDAPLPRDWMGLMLVLILLGLAAALLPATMLWVASQTGGVLSGPDGPYAPDQFQYLAWIRDSAEHVFARNLFSIPAGEPVFLHPMWLFSGALWRAGLPIEHALLPWKVVTILALGGSVYAYTSRFFQRRHERICAALIGLFYVSPVVPLLELAVGPLQMAGGTIQMSFETLNVIGVWGYAPSGLATALMPLYLLKLERAVSLPNNRGATLGAASLGLLAAWIHPWQGATLGLLTASLMLSQRLLRRPEPYVCGVATALPLLGYLAVPLIDPDWRRVQGYIETPPPALRDLAIVFLPLLALCAWRVRRPQGSFGEHALFLWPLAAFVHLLVGPAVTLHALAGVTIPLGVLAVRSAASVPRLLTPLALLLAIPGYAYLAGRLVHHVEDRARPEALVIDPGEAAALRFLAAAPPGGVLADVFLGSAVPAWTGHPVWAGHFVWTPDFFERWPQISALLTEQMEARAAREFIAATGARYVLIGCRDSVDLDELLGPRVVSRHEFGCAKVYALY